MILYVDIPILEPINYYMEKYLKFIFSGIVLGVSGPFLTKKLHH